MIESFRGFPMSRIAAADLPRLAFGVALVLVGALMQSPETLAGEPLAHGILLLTGCALILHRVGDPGRLGGEGRWLPVALAGAAACLGFLSPWAGGLRPLAVDLAAALVALSLATAFFGRPMAGALAVPVLVVYVLVPVLPLFEAALSYPMRRLSAILAAALLSVGPQGVELNGTELVLGSLKVSVTSACSGLTLLQNLIWVAWWTVVVRHRGFVSRLLHLSLAVPAVVLANTLRVVALALMAQVLGEGSLTGPGHVTIGWAAVVLAGVLFLALEHLFPATAEERSRASGASQAAPSGRIK